MSFSDIDYSFFLNFDIILQVILSIFGLFYFIFKRNSHYLLLAFSFLLFNSISLYFLNTSYTSTINKNIITYTISTLICISILQYSLNEFELNLFRRKSYIKYYIALLLSFIILFIIPYTTSENFQLSKELFILPHLLFALIFSIQFLGALRPLFFCLSVKRKVYNFLGLFSIIAVFIFGFLNLIIDTNFISITFLNIYFYVISLLFVFSIFIRSDPESKIIKSRNELILEKMNYVGLTESEKKISLILLNNPSIKYKEIATQTHMTERAVSSYLSKSFKKVGVNKKQDYISVFQYIK